MADFLASFNFGAPDAVPSKPSSCVSVDELQTRLHTILEEQTTPTRAEHISTTLDISATAQISLHVPQNENEVLDDLNNVDPSLGGIWTCGVATASEGQTVRVVNATDVLSNQHQDDPFPQQAVARHIVATVGATDGRSWVMRDMSRGPEGWSFSYLCKDSVQQWNRQNKEKSKLVIGDYTNKVPDPAAMSRPAFDCRGSVKISFPQGGRAISVIYDHTLIHKTVAEIAELFKPTPRQLAAQTPRKEKTPKKSASVKKRRDSTKPRNESGKPQKRIKKVDGEPTDETGHEAQLLAELAQNGQAAHDLSKDGVADGKDKDAEEAGGQSEVITSSVLGSFPINVSPEEANRRREFAIKNLSEAGVDPDSLSTEQFNIFANQSPDLQKESLNMLVKYGAERLRIVHPSSKDSSNSASAGNSTTAVDASPATPSAPSTAKGPVPQSQGSGRESKGRKLGKSRVACLKCKQRRVKCPRERPACSECETGGLGCEYAPQKPRVRKVLSEAIVSADYDEGDDDLTQLGHEPRGEQAGDSREAEDDGQDLSAEADYSSYPQIPVTGMLTPTGVTQEHNPYFRSLSHSEDPPHGSQQMQTNLTGLMQDRSRASNHRLSANSPQLQDVMALSQAALEHQKESPSLNRAGSRAQSRQGQRAQATATRSTQLAVNGSQLQPSQQAVDSSTPDSSHRTSSVGMNDASTYASYDRYPDAMSNGPLDRISYEPYQYQRTTPSAASYLSYDHGHNTSSSFSTDNQALTILASALSSSVGNASQLADGRSSSRARSPYNAPSGLPLGQASASPQDVNMRSADQTARPGKGSMQQRPPQHPNPHQQQHQQPNLHQNQHQHQNQDQNMQEHQRQRQQQQPQHQQVLHNNQDQPQQSQAWYDFNNNPGGNGSFQSGNHNQGTNYGWKLPDKSWGGVS
ncbi:hypothetical protein RJ55_07967 [Drechmeria coniospora]|nr:hypothetical protein RJ55_07967 [Drechmeria coniospora]